MQVIYERCAGLDLHKKTVVACVWISENNRASKEVKSFGTTTPDLLELLDWLQKRRVTHAAMESTGVYWKPIYQILEGHLELVLLNAQHIKAVPGRKTDVADAEWIGDLLRHGLVRGSFVPPMPQRELRELTRHRSNLVNKRSQASNELQKVLESTNLKLQSVVTDINGVSARAMLDALLSGKCDVQLLAELAKGRLRNKKPELMKALQGVVKDHHKMIMGQLLCDMDLFNEQIQEVSGEIERRIKKDQDKMDRIDHIPGVNQRVGEVIVAEVGTDMERFPSEAHLCSWAGLCPGNNESAGKRKSSRIRPGNRALKAALVEAANGAARTKGSYLSALYHRLAAKRGKKRALVAVARTILSIVYHMFKKGTRYQDLGADYYDRRNPDKLLAKLSQRITQLGYQVSLTPIPT